MANIRVTPEELRSVAGQFKSSHDEAQTMIQQLASTIKNLDANWDGIASQRFYQNFEVWQKQMLEFSGLLAEISQSLTEIAGRFEQADQQVGAPVHYGPGGPQLVP